MPQLPVLYHSSNLRPNLHKRGPSSRMGQGLWRVLGCPWPCIRWQSHSMGSLPQLFPRKVPRLNKRESSQEWTRKIAAQTPTNQQVHLKIWRAGLTGRISSWQPRNSPVIPPWPSPKHPRRSNEGRSASHISGSEAMSSQSSPIQADNQQYCQMEGAPPTKSFPKC